jgi:hypothetical protein
MRGRAICDLNPLAVGTWFGKDIFCCSCICHASSQVLADKRVQSSGDMNRGPGYTVPVEHSHYSPEQILWLMAVKYQ